MKLVFKVLCLCMLIGVQACDGLWDPNGVIIYDKDDLENISGGDKGKPEYQYNNSITVNGKNLKYSISNIKPSVGDVIKVLADSDTDPKPDILILWDSEEIAHFYSLPDSLEIKITDPGVHKITFEGNFGEGSSRTSSVDITVE